MRHRVRSRRDDTAVVLGAMFLGAFYGGAVGFIAGLVLGALLSG